MKLQSFDRTNLQAVRAALEAAINSSAALKEMGITIESGRCTFLEKECTFKVKMTLEGAPTLADRRSNDLDFVCRMNKITHEQLTRPFQMHGSEYRVVGYKMRASVRPFVIMRSDGKKFIIDTETISRKLGINLDNF